eukprot:1026122_1
MLPGLCRLVQQTTTTQPGADRTVFPITNIRIEELRNTLYEWLPIQLSIRKIRTINKPPRHSQEQIEQFFPSQIFELKNLETLYMSGYPFSYLSERLGQLTNLKTIIITGSPIIRLPVALGQLKQLEKIDFYCSRRMKYIPYEILHCKQLRSTKMGTSRLYVNYKNGLLLPPLPKALEIENVIDSFASMLDAYDWPNGLIQIILDYLPHTTCSNEQCKKPICFKECIHYGWTRQCPGTDTICLLAKMCSNSCINSIADKTRFYLQREKKGSDNEDKVWFKNCNVDADGNEISDKAVVQRWEDKISELLDRFEYFWKYNLERDYLSYKLTEELNGEVVVVFDYDTVVR